MIFSTGPSRRRSPQQFHAGRIDGTDSFLIDDHVADRVEIVAGQRGCLGNREHRLGGLSRLRARRSWTSCLTRAKKASTGGAGRGCGIMSGIGMAYVEGRDDRSVVVPITISGVSLSARPESEKGDAGQFTSWPIRQMSCSAGLPCPLQAAIDCKQWTVKSAVAVAEDRVPSGMSNCL